MKVNVISVEQVCKVPGISLEISVRQAETILAVLGQCNCLDEGDEVSPLYSALQIALAKAAGVRDYTYYYGSLEAYQNSLGSMSIRKRKC